MFMLVVVCWRVLRAVWSCIIVIYKRIFVREHTERIQSSRLWYVWHVRTDKLTHSSTQLW